MPQFFQVCVWHKRQNIIFLPQFWHLRIRSENLNSDWHIAVRKDNLLYFLHRKRLECIASWKLFSFKFTLVKKCLGRLDLKCNESKSQACLVKSGIFPRIISFVCSENCWGESFNQENINQYLPIHLGSSALQWDVSV